MEVFTKDFLDDIGATDVGSLLRYDLSTEFEYNDANSQGTGGQPSDTQQPWAAVRRVDYDYYEAAWSPTWGAVHLEGGLHGRADDLRTASISDPAHDKVVSGITSAGTTATATATGHGYQVGDTVVIRGAGTGDPYYDPCNGTFIVTAVASNTFQFTIAASVTGTDTSTTIRAVKPLETSYYRYWQAHTHLNKAYSPLRLVVTGESYARMRAGGVNPFLSTTTDDDIKPFADHYFRYEAWQDHEAYTNQADHKDRFRVIEEIAQGAGCSACSGGQGAFKFSYSLNPTADTDRTTTQYNVWRYKTIEYLPDTTNTPTTGTLGTGALTSTGTTATVTWTAHGYLVGERVTLSGAAESEYNGTFEITSVTTNTFSFKLLGDPSGSSASGTVSASVDTQYRDNDQNIVFTNEVGEVMLQVFHEVGTGRKWVCHAVRRQGQGVVDGGAFGSQWLRRDQVRPAELERPHQ